jgi:Fasciclin domain/Domain of unknown function (DUF4397)
MPRTHRFIMFMLFTIALMLLAACGGAPAATAPTAASAQANAPATTAASAPTALPPTAAAPTVALAPTAAATAAPASTSALLADTNPEKPNDATQGRLRISNCVAGGPNVDMLINGKLTVNGGVTQQNLESLHIGGYQYLAPGTYSIAIVPTGEGIDKALLGPLDVPIVAGHRYTLAMLGQLDEKSHTPLVVDETDAYQKAGLAPNTWGHILINNIKGSSAISWLQDQAGEKDVPYGGFAASAIPAGPFKDGKIIINGADKPVIDSWGSGFLLPGTDMLDCVGGNYPDTHGSEGSPQTSALSLLDYLQQRNEIGAKYPGKIQTFNTFLSALKTAGLTDAITQGGPYLIFAPTDAAFAALPKEKLDALLADPKALADLIHAHLIEGYFPYGTIGPIGQGFNRTVTNMRGEQFKVTGDDSGLLINSKLIGETSGTFIANGTRMMTVSKLLLDVK